MHFALRLAAFTTLLLTSHSNALFLPVRRPSILALARTQEVDVPSQLRRGVRMLQSQGHMNGGKLHFCHNTCGLYDGGTVEQYLKDVKYFLDRHPNEVLTFIFTNPENLSVDKVWKPVFDSAGITNLTYVPPQPVITRDDWPTLGEMIASNKRVVVFLDKGAENKTDPASAFILPQFQMMWEDPYDPTDAKWPCKVDRTAGPLAPSQQLNLMNHNLNVNLIPVGRGVRLPDRLSSPRTNGIRSILKHAANCAPLVEDRAPNFVMLDYVNVGQGLEAVNRLNGFAFDS